MSKIVRIDEDCELLLRKYSDGSLSDCIRAMESKISATPESQGIAMESTGLLDGETMKELMRGILKTELDKFTKKIEAGHANTHAEFMKYLSSGQGAIKVPYHKINGEVVPYTKGPQTVVAEEGGKQVVPERGFRTALEIQKEGK